MKNTWRIPRWMFSSLTTAASVLLIALMTACSGGSEAIDASPPKPDAADVCRLPTGFTFRVNTNKSLSSFGAMGVLHNQRLPDDVAFGVKVTSCQGDGCTGTCKFEGPSQPNGAVQRKRCYSRLSQLCTQDSDCPAEGIRRCIYVYEAPQTLPIRISAGPNVGKFNACAWGYIAPSVAGQVPIISGQIELVTGESDIKLTSFGVANQAPAGAFRGACAICAGDPIPNDGIKGGTCQTSPLADATREIADQSPDIGQPCDTHRFGSGAFQAYSYSMDCSPTVTALDRTPGTATGGSLTSLGYTATINANSPVCSYYKDDATPPKCFCGACKVSSKGCQSDADCGADGPCGYVPPTCDPNPFPFTDGLTLNPDFKTSVMIGGAPVPVSVGQCRAPEAIGFNASVGNSCVNHMCNWDPVALVGSCMSKLTGGKISCFPDGQGASISAVGGAMKVGSSYVADMANVTCMGITPSAQVNGQFGIPGPLFLTRSFRISPEYAQ
jgi:hypothetical protein